MRWVQSIRSVIAEHQAIFGCPDRAYLITAILTMITTGLMVLEIGCFVAAFGGDQ
jgi:coenzyme F420-reducing hydrogenase gamma subunit